MSEDKLPPAPTGTQAPGRRLWRSVWEKYKLDEHETALLTEAVRTVDVLADLDVAIRRDGVTIETPQGLRAHPALVEARAQRMVLARLLAALRLPEEEQAAGRPQRRGGARRPYGFTVVS